MNPPPAVKFEVLKTLDIIRMMVSTGTMIFHTIMTVLPLAIHCTPSRFKAVNTNIATMATTSPLQVSSELEFTRPCHHFAFRYPSEASTSMGAMATAWR